MQAFAEAWRGLSQLTRGRLITLSGVLCICWDSPTYRLLVLRLPQDSLEFGLAVSFWRGLVEVLVIGAQLLIANGVPGSKQQLVALGTKNILLATAMLARVPSVRPSA